MSNKKLESQKPNKLTPVKVLAYAFIAISSFFFVWDTVLWLTPDPGLAPVGTKLFAVLSGVPAVLLTITLVARAQLRKRPPDSWLIGTFAVYVLIIAVDWIAVVNSGI